MILSLFAVASLSILSGLRASVGKLLPQMTVEAKLAGMSHRPTFTSGLGWKDDAVRSPATAATALPPPQDDGASQIGIVIVDIRPRDEWVNKRVLQLLRQVMATAPGIACEVWVNPDSRFPDNLLAHLKTQKASVSLRYMPAVHNTGERHTIDLHGTHGGHIGKALALRDSRFEFPILLDGDSWPCSDWLQSVNNATLEADVIWSRAPLPFGASFNNATTHSSPLIPGQMGAFRHFAERNTGTIFGVRKTPFSRLWLTDALDMRANQSSSQRRKNYRAFADQAAFRESFFLHREGLREYLFPLDRACRDPEHKKYKCSSCACECSKCLFIHGQQHFDRCAKKKRKIEAGRAEGNGRGEFVEEHGSGRM